MTTSGQGTTTTTRPDPKRPKRSNGEGWVRKLPSGAWQVRVTLDGRQRKVSASTKAEALKRAAALKAAPGLIAGLPPRPTLADWLRHYTATILPGTVKLTTENSYKLIVDRYLVPELGKVTLADLTPAHVRQALRRMEEGTGATKALSANTRRLALAVLRRALKIAEREGLVARNVAALVDGVKLGRSDKRSLTPEQAVQLREAIERAEPMEHALLMTLLATGARKGEILGLRWGDVDLDAGTCAVRRTLSRRPADQRNGWKRNGGAATLYLADSTKTDRQRVVHLGEHAVTALRRWKRSQAEQRLACPTMPEGLGWGMGFPDDLVFTGERGQAIDLGRPNKMLDAIAEPIGLGHWTVHELRHTAASLMFSVGVPLLTISKTLGHADLATTARVYTHLVDRQERSAVDALAGVLSGTGGAASGSGS